MILGAKPVVIAHTKSQTILWRHGQAFLVFDGRLDPPPIVPSGWLDPDKQALAFSLANTGLPGQTPSLIWLVVAQPDVFPAWSLDSSQMILMQNTTLFADLHLLSRGDGEAGALTPIGTGCSSGCAGNVDPLPPLTKPRYCWHYKTC